MASEWVTTTVALDPDLLRAVKAWAERSGRPDDDIVNEALRHYLATIEQAADRQALSALLEGRIGQSDLSDAEALALATSELHVARKARAASPR